MKIHLLFILFFVLILSGCATEQKYQEKLNDWINADEVELISSWGIPDKTYEVDGTKFLSYNRENHYMTIGSDSRYVSNRVGNTIYTNKILGTPDQLVNTWCSTIFSIKNKKIINVSFNGNECTSY